MPKEVAVFAEGAGGTQRGTPNDDTHLPQLFKSNQKSCDKDHVVHWSLKRGPFFIYNTELKPTTAHANTAVVPGKRVGSILKVSLVRLLSTDSLLFMGVGDQSIYSWRQRGPKSHPKSTPRHGLFPGCNPEGCESHTGKGISQRVIACEHGKTKSNFIVKEQDRKLLMSSWWEIIRNI